MFDGLGERAVVVGDARTHAIIIAVPLSSLQFECRTIRIGRPRGGWRHRGEGRSVARHQEGTGGHVNGQQRWTNPGQAGEGPPVLHLHGSSTSSLSHLPLLERCTALRSVAVDRPGFGLSQPTRVLQRRFRESAIDLVGDVLDELQWRSATVAGGSMGGTWALWYALAHPERVTRLVLLGSAPLLPGTRPPAPLRTATTPLLGELLVRFAKPNARILQRLMATVGEGDTIIRYPDLVDALVAAAHDRVAAQTNLAELRAVRSVLGFRASVRIRTDELRDLRVPTLLIWGDSDPVGCVEAARTAADLIPDARLEVLPAVMFPGSATRTGWQGS
ncbi:MAG: alpha/beta fold hydrolase [Nocardioidaceae bacterium]